MSGSQITSGRDVFISDGRISAIEPTGTEVLPETWTVVNGDGNYLLPGLSDMHMHDFGAFEEQFDDFDFAPQFLRYGVTRVLDLIGLDQVLAYRESDRGEASIPEFYISSPFVSPPQFSTPEEVSAAVRRYSAQGFDIIKVHGDMSEEAYTALNQTAREVGIRVTGHAQRDRGISPVLEEHQDLVHTEEFVYAEFHAGQFEVLVPFLLSVIFLVTILVTTLVWWWKGAFRGSTDPGVSQDLVKLRRLALLFLGLQVPLIAIYPELSSISYPFNLVGRGHSLVQSSMILAPFWVIAFVLSWRFVAAFKAAKVGGHRRWPLGVVISGLVLISVASAMPARHLNKLTDENLDALATRVAQSGIWVTPNLISKRTFARENTDEYFEMLARPEMALLRPELREAWAGGSLSNRNLASEIFSADYSHYRAMSRLTGALQRAGVPLMAGTDTPLAFVWPGESLIEELLLLKLAGLSNFEALETATTNPALYMTGDPIDGQVVIGAPANLVLVGGNPLQELNHLRDVRGVLARGRWLSRDKLDEGLEALEAKYAG